MILSCTSSAVWETLTGQNGCLFCLLRPSQNSSCPQREGFFLERSFPKWSQQDPNMVPEQCTNDSQMIPKPFQDAPKLQLKTCLEQVPKRFKIWSQNEIPQVFFDKIVFWGSGFQAARRWSQGRSHGVKSDPKALQNYPKAPKMGSQSRQLP